MDVLGLWNMPSWAVSFNCFQHLGLLGFSISYKSSWSRCLKYAVYVYWQTLVTFGLHSLRDFMFVKDHLWLDLHLCDEKEQETTFMHSFGSLRSFTRRKKSFLYCPALWSSIWSFSLLLVYSALAIYHKVLQHPQWTEILHFRYIIQDMECSPTLGEMDIYTWFMRAFRIYEELFVGKLNTSPDTVQDSPLS